MDKWNCLTSLFTVLHSYRDDGRVIMKDSVSQSPVYDKKAGWSVKSEIRNQFIVRTPDKVMYIINDQNATNRSDKGR